MEDEHADEHLLSLLQRCCGTLEELSVRRNWLSVNGALRVVEAVARRLAHGAQDEPEVAERMVQRKSFRWDAKQCFADLTVVASTTMGALSKVRLVTTEEQVMTRPLRQHKPYKTAVGITTKL